GVDVTDFARLGGLLNEIKPDFIVNCIGIVKQRKESTQAIPSITINSLLPHVLAQLASHWGGNVIHPSTDCVFSGRRGRYTEDDPPDADDLYGKSKALGELRDVENVLTLRTSIIGRELLNYGSLLEWLLSQRGRSVHGYTRVIYSGVTTNQFAKVTGWLIANFPNLSGLYQLTAEATAKHDLVTMLRDAYDLDVRIVPDDSIVSDRSMLGGRLREATGYVTPPWSTLVSELAGDPTPYAEWTERGAGGPR
ncbi:MAG: sugar nucleotide-binding protein, partial [Acidobacteria bacterium]|nr:sugar nucleotide-binding protein [Acidobacteriota bacterium]